MTSIVVVSAGLGVPSSTRLLADRLASATGVALEETSIPTSITTIELRDIAHEITDHVLTCFAGPTVGGALDAVRRADGLIVVTPVFAASYSGLFKMFFDVLEEGALDGKPVLIAATAGTARHSLVLEHALRPLFAYLHAVVVPTGVFAAADDFGDVGLEGRVTRAAGELAALVSRDTPDGVSTRRPSVEEQFADPIPFEDLLKQASAA